MFELTCIDHRRYPSQGTMRPYCIVFFFPLQSNLLCFSDGGEGMEVQALVPEFAIKAFYPCILVGFSRVNEMPVYTVTGSPAHNGGALEFRAVIAHDNLRYSTRYQQNVEYSGNPVSGKTKVGFYLKALPGTSINDVQETNLPAAGKSIVHEIQSPDAIGTFWNRKRLCGRPKALGFPAILQLKLADTIEPVDAFSIDLLTSKTDRIENARQTPSGKPLRNVSYSLHKPFIRRSVRRDIFIPSDCYPGQKTRSAKRNADRSQCVHNRPALRTRYQFFFITSRMASISRSRSATMRLSRPFSVSSSRNRRISWTPMPVNLLRQLKNVCSLIPCFRQISLIFPFCPSDRILMICSSVYRFLIRASIGMSKINHGNSYQSCDTKQG